MSHKHCFKKSFRLSNYEITSGFQNVKFKYVSKDFLYLISSVVNPPQQGIVVILSKKKVKHAVDRNLIRRLFREFYRCNQDTFQDVSLIIMPRKRLLQAHQFEKNSIWQNINDFFLQFQSH